LHFAISSKTKPKVNRLIPCTMLRPNDILISEHHTSRVVALLIHLFIIQYCAAL